MENKNGGDIRAFPLSPKSSFKKAIDIMSPLRKVLGRVYNQHFKTEKRPILSHSGRRPGIQQQNTHWIPVFTGMTTVVSVLFVQM